MNTLVVPFIRMTRRDGQQELATLPGAIAAMFRFKANDIDDGRLVVAFTALRPHQRHAWHAFLVQLATLALLKAGRSDPPDGEGGYDEDEWRGLLLGLTPGHPDDAPWCLVSAPDRPALLQPSAGNLAGLRNTVPTPDGLDMLVTSKAHDLKPAVMVQAHPDDWLFALLTLQTTEGFLGAGNYGISRMNGGFANRPALGLAPAGGPGAHMVRDVQRLLMMERPPGYAENGGLALVWLEPWDGTASLSRDRLHPLYIEVCRRVRLVSEEGTTVARAGNSKVPRIVPTPGGVTGDPWTPLRTDKEGLKTLTVDNRGFGYRPMVDILFPSNGSLAPLQQVAGDDAAEGLALVARALVRGQGKTEGYHERRVSLSRIVQRKLAGPVATDPVADIARLRVQLAGEMARTLRFALMCLFENGPDKVEGKNDAAGRKAEPFTARFERAVDTDFFDALWREVEHDDPAARHAERSAWVRSLLRRAEALLHEADGAGARSSKRRYRGRVQANAALHGAASTWATTSRPKACPMPPDPAPAPDLPPTMTTSTRPDLARIVLRIAAQLDPDIIGTGALASLRRLDPKGTLAAPALQRILWAFLPETWLGTDGLRQWALIVHALALAAPGGIHATGREGSLGAALFAAGFSEGRLTRMLDAGPAELPVDIPRAVRFLAAKRQGFDPVALARWVQGIAAGGERADRQRTDLAREYYRADRQAAA